MMDKHAIAQIISVISAAFPNFTPTEQTVDFYWQTLRDIPERELKAATLASAAEAGRKFAPTVGEIRGKVSDLRALRRATPTSYEAWQEVQKAPKLRILIDSFEERQDGVWVAHGREFKWSDPLVERAAVLLGWPNFPGPADERTADRARFIECYEQLLHQAAEHDMLLPEVKGYLEDARAQPDQKPKLLRGFLNVKTVQPKGRGQPGLSSEGLGDGGQAPGSA